MVVPYELLLIGGFAALDPRLGMSAEGRQREYATYMQSFGRDRVVSPRVTAFSGRRFLQVIGERPFPE